MAISTLTAPLSLFGDEETRRVWSKSLYGSARKSNVARMADTVECVLKYRCFFFFFFFFFFFERVLLS